MEAIERRLSYRYRCFECGVGVVTQQLEVIVVELEKRISFWIQVHLRQWSGCARKLRVRLLEVIHVYMGVTERVNKLSRAEPGYLGDHHRQQGIGRDVKGQAEEYVSATLIKLTR